MNARRRAYVRHDASCLDPRVRDGDRVRRWLDPHQRRFRGNHIFQQLNVPLCKFLSVTQEPFRDLGAAAIDVIWNNDLITEPIEKSYRLNSDLGIIVIGKLITKKKDTAIGQ